MSRENEVDKSEFEEMTRMYKTVLVEDISVGNVTNKIDETITEMEKSGYRLITMSFLGTQRAVLVFKKGLKGSML